MKFKKKLRIFIYQLIKSKKSTKKWISITANIYKKIVDKKLKIYLQIKNLLIKANN